ncbi:MAG: ATP-dependent Clp protease proteolytic subunit [Clostridia bacterium]|nr:ATP-dependent Clp protease proteolytic subunit [Clostridia bacterium]
MLNKKEDKGAFGTENEKDQIPSGICTKNDDFPIYCLSIVGQIEGHTGLGGEIKSTKYESVLPELVAVEENPAVKGMLVLLNTVGGDVEAGLAISELIAGMSKPTVSLVLGGGHSIGIPLAVAAKRSFIARSATMTLHPVRFNGLVLGVSRSFTYLEKMQDRISTFITDHSRVSEKTLRDLMYSSEELAGDMGSLIDGTKAVDIGLIDRLGGLKDALAELRGMASGQTLKIH